MSDKAFVGIFRSILGKVMESYDPTAIVLQCGADSLSGDRLGCFNLSLEGHADCVEFMKSFNRPLLLLGGGGYTMRNVARCWTAETAVALDTELDPQLPFTDYYEYFGPDYGLPITPSNMEDLNSPEELQKIQELLIRNLCATPVARPAQMPVDSPGCWYRPAGMTSRTGRLFLSKSDRTMRRRFSPMVGRRSTRNEIRMCAQTWRAGTGA